MVETLVRYALKFRFVITLLIVGLTVLATSYFFKNVGISDNSLPIWFETDDPAYVTYQDYVKTFGNDRLIFLGFKVPEVFDAEFLKFIQEITAALSELPDVERITSITDAEYIESSRDEIKIAPFIESVPLDLSHLSLFKSKALKEPDYVGNILSEDSQVTAIVAKINTGHSIKESSLLKKRILEVIDKINTHHYPYYLAGSPITDEAFDTLVVRDQLVFMPVTFALVFLMLLFFFRNIGISLVPTLVQIIVIFWMVAFYYFLGYKMNIVAGMMVPILMAVCIADSVHMMLEYYRERALGRHREQALINSAKHLWRPCLYTALTTLAGFISFQSSSIAPINVLGNMTAIGVMLAFVFTIFIIPIVLSYYPEPKKEITLHVNENSVQKFLKRVTDLNERHYKTITALFLFLTLLSLIGMTRLTVETNFLKYFPKESKVRQDLEFFDHNLAGVGAYEIVLSSDDLNREIARDPKVLNLVDQFKKEALSMPQTREVYSHTDTIKKLNQAFHEGEALSYQIPQSSEGVAQLLLLASSSGETEIDQYKTPDDRKIHISLRTNWGSSEKMNHYLQDMEKKARALFEPNHIQLLLTGYGPLWIKLDHDILVSQVVSFLIAFVTVSIMMIFFLKSWKVGLISMVPNIMPILFTMGIMGFMGIHLNVSTVMIAGVTIGITVDDTIHYLTRFKEYLRQEKDYLKAIRLTNQTIGTAIVFTACLLIGGFSVLCLGSFMPSIYFGSMVALTLFLSIFCEIFLTPILLMWFKPFKI